MAKKTKKIRESELRQEIQEKLHQEFEAQQNEQSRVKLEPQQEEHPPINEELQELLLKGYLEAEIYGQFPEFIRCENHLNEIKWLTPAELEDEYEFYPVEESRFQRFKNKFSGKPSMPDIQNEQLKTKIPAIRSEIEKDANKRRAHFEKLRSREKANKKSDQKEKIYQEELDKFYSKKKGYKKYINHLNETKWMTKEERKNQDEFLDEVETPAQIWRKRLSYVSIVAVIILLVWLGVYWGSDPVAKKAYLLIQTNDLQAQLYVDKVLAVGYTAGTAYPVIPGLREVSLIRSGYKSVPETQMVSLAAKDTVTLEFELSESKLGDAGRVHIKAPHEDAAIIVNGVFKGTLLNADSLTLEAGDYTLMLEKQGFVVRPPQAAFSLKAGDTVELEFSMLPGKSKREARSGQQATKNGLLEVRSNVPNADIYLDGQKTDFKTDYVLQQIPLGSHTVRVEKQGYKVYPKENVIRLSNKEKYGVVDFTLSSTVRRVTLETRPVSGEIIIDGKVVGRGSAQVSLALGPHRIEFGAVNNYRVPARKSINIEANGPDKLYFDYSLDFQLSFIAGKKLDRPEMGSVQSGYLFEEDDFKQSATTGPALEFNKAINDQVWMLGYGFQYRNPPGKDALLFNVFIPDNMDLSQPLALKLWIYQSKDLYPLALRGDAYFSVDVNRFRLKRNALPRFKSEQIAPQNFESYPINELLHPGFNRILIKTTAATKAYVMLWKAAIE